MNASHLFHRAAYAQIRPRLLSEITFSFYSQPLSSPQGSDLSLLRTAAEDCYGCQDNPGSRTAPPMTLYTQLISLHRTEGDALGRHQLPFPLWLLSLVKVVVDFLFSLILTSEEQGHCVRCRRLLPRPGFGGSVGIRFGLKPKLDLLISSPLMFSSSHSGLSYRMVERVGGFPGCQGGEGAP